MVKVKIHTLIAALGLLCGACNNDIFEDPLPDVPEEIYLDGYEGTETVTISKKGLKNVAFSDSYGYNWDPFTTYYDKEGNELRSPSHIDDVSKAVYSCRMFAVQFNLKGDEVEIVALDNAHTDPVEMGICLDYGYALKYVNIKIGVGRPHEIKGFGYFSDEYTTGTETLRAFRENITNNTAQPIKVTLFPFKDFPSRLTLTPDDNDDWSLRSVGTVRVPLCEDGEWSVYDTEDVEAAIGGTTTFISETVNVNEEAYIEIPPNTAISATLYVTYAKLKTGYSANVGLPNTDLDWGVSGTLEAMQPIGYKIETSVVAL